MRARHALHAASLAALFLAAYAWFLPPEPPESWGTNTAVRFYLAKGLGLDGSFAIERHYQKGIDAASFGGHLYSGKAPAASFLAAPVIRALSAARGGTAGVSDRMLLYAARLAVVSIPSVLMILALHGFLLRRGISCRSADLAVLGYGLGTMAFPYSTEFMGHQLAAVFLFWCFLCLWAGRAPGRPNGFSLAAGLFAGMAAAAEYQAAVISAILFLFLGPSPRRPVRFLLFVLGCLPGAAMALGYNYACFGNPLSFPYAHEAMPVARLVQGRGLFGVQAPRFVPLVKLAFSPWRGIFFGSPFLLLSIPGARLLWREGAAGRRLAALCICAFGAFILFNSSYGAWSGGASFGPRFLVPVIPFLVIPAAESLSRRGRGAAVLSALLAAYSIAFHFVGTSAGPTAHEYLRNPVREFLLPSLLRGNVRPNWGGEAGLAGAWGLLPLAVFLPLCGLFARMTRVEGPVRREPCAADGVERGLLTACGAAAFVMACLFAFHGTDATPFRYAVLGHAYDAAGDADAAIPFFEKALSMDPREMRVVDDLTRILLEKGEYGKAIEANVRALAANPRDANLQARVGRLMVFCDSEEGRRNGDGKGRRMTRRAASAILGPP